MENEICDCCNEKKDTDYYNDNTLSLCIDCLDTYYDYEESDKRYIEKREINLIG